MYEITLQLRSELFNPATKQHIKIGHSNGFLFGNECLGIISDCVWNCKSRLFICYLFVTNCTEIAVGNNKKIVIYFSGIYICFSVRYFQKRLGILWR